MTSVTGRNVISCSKWSYIGCQNWNLLSHPNATLAPQARQARASELRGTSANSKASGELLAESLVWYPGKIMGYTLVSGQTPPGHHQLRPGISSCIFSRSDHVNKPWQTSSNLETCQSNSNKIKINLINFVLGLMLGAMFHLFTSLHSEIIVPVHYQWKLF